MSVFDIDINNITHQTSKIEVRKNLQLHLHSWRNSSTPDKVIVAIHGLGGHGAYYADSLAPYVTTEKTVVYAPDLRGHGLSEGTRGDIDSFSDFQADVAAVVRFARQQHPQLPIFLLGESMGTSIALTYAATAPQDARPDALALVACVVAPAVTPRPNEVFRTLYFAARDRRKTSIPITGREEMGVRDLEFIKVLKSDTLFNRKVSVRFLSSMTLHMQKAIRLHAQLKIPVFMAIGGRDFTISHRRTRTFFGRIAATDKELHYFPEAYHALLNDPDAPLVRERLVKWMERQRKNHAWANEN